MALIDPVADPKVNDDGSIVEDETKVEAPEEPKLPEKFQGKSAEDIADRLLSQLHDEITRADADLHAVGERIKRLYTVHDRLAQEWRVDRSLVEEFDDPQASSDRTQH